MRGMFFHHGGQGCHSARTFSHRDDFGRGRFAGERGGRMGGRGFRDGHFGGRGGFGHGGLRLVLLKLISEKPSHGYELIKAVEDLFDGYSPSPGVIYPTLSWLEDEGFITITAGEDGRKQAAITAAGSEFLAQKADAVAALFTAAGEGEGGDNPRRHQVFRALKNLGMVVGLRMRRERLSREEAQALADTVTDMIDEIARKIERS